MKKLVLLGMGIVVVLLVGVLWFMFGHEKNQDSASPPASNSNTRENSQSNTDDYNIPSDIPIYPDSTFQNTYEKDRQVTVDFVVDNASTEDLSKFYNEKLQSLGWTDIYESYSGIKAVKDDKKIRVFVQIEKEGKLYYGIQYTK